MQITKKKNGQKRKPMKRRLANGAKGTVTCTVPDVPMSVHNKLKKYHLKIMGERGKHYVLMQAYTEFLKEKTKGM